MGHSNSLKQMGLAMRNYESAFRQLPPLYGINSGNASNFSVEAVLLPFSERGNLFSQLDFSQRMQKGNYLGTLR
jgi:hypothetical protein